jgi:hypothetical protein
MTLSQLSDALRKLPGSGHPAFFRTPDGKMWEPTKVVSTWEADGTSDQIETIIELKKVS